MLGSDGAQPATVVAAGRTTGWSAGNAYDGLHVHEAQPEGCARDEEILRTDDALGRDVVGRTSAPGASLGADGVVDRDRDVAGMRARASGVLEQVEQRADGLGLVLRRTGCGVGGNAGGNLRQRGDHAAKLAPDERLHARRRRGIGRAQPPPFERSAAQTGQRRRREAGDQETAPAHQPEHRVRA